MSLVASELVFAKRTQDSGVSAGCASGVFLRLVTIKFPSCFNFGKSGRWGCGRLGCRALWFEGSKGMAAGFGEKWYVAGCKEERDWEDGSSLKAGSAGESGHSGHRH